MKEIKVERSTIDLPSFVKRAALPTDVSRYVSENCIVTMDGSPIMVQLKATEHLSALRAAVQQIKYEKNTRTTGLKTQSRVFGYSPRVTVRRDFCSASALMGENAGVANILVSAANLVAQKYREVFPELYAQHLASAEEEVLPEWRIGATPFTSGIINKNNPLKYHFDSGNFSRCASCMLVFKQDVEGGFLSCPEYNIGFELPDCSLFIFDGQSILHGVTPIRRLTQQAFRYSVVYYSLRGMWNCLPLTEELARIRKVKTIREQDRAKGREFMEAKLGRRRS